MDLKGIRDILDSDNSVDAKERYIIVLLAKDRDAIPNILKVLAEEREFNTSLIDDANLELSRAHTFIEVMNPKLLDKKENHTTTMHSGVTKEFILDKIAGFYIKYKGRITHSFNRFN